MWIKKKNATNLQRVDAKKFLPDWRTEHGELTELKMNPAKKTRGKMNIKSADKLINM